MNQIQADRFATWYHFIKDMVPEKNFSMDMFYNGNPKDIVNFEKNKNCGSTACLAGYLPAIFDDFCYSSEDSDAPSLLKNIIQKEEINILCKSKKKITSIIIEQGDIIKDISEFFGIEDKDVIKLIYPNEDYNGYFEPSKSDMLKKMRDLADDYGWEIDYETKNKKTTSRNRRRKGVSRT